MARDVLLPELSENLPDARVVRILVSPGQKVAADAPLMELETDKASVELPAPFEGTVLSIAVKEGDEVKAGGRLMIFDEPAASDEPAPSPRRSGAEMPAHTAPASPKAADASPAAPPVVTAAGAPEPQQDARPRVAASPATRRYAREHGIELASVKGSGPGGYVFLDDLKLLTGGAAPALAAAAPPLPDFSAWGPVRIEPMSNIRRRTAEHVALSWSEAVRITHFDQADITDLEKLRVKYADRARKAGGNLTMAVMVVKAAALGLKLHPAFNASIDMPNRRIIYKEYRNIGIAVNTPRGLLVPVIRDADRKNLIDISAEVIRLAQRARDGSIGLNELQGGTFTVTNIGSIGGRWFTPVLNYPESGILGMGRSFEEVALVNGTCRLRTVLPLSLSYDHRLIDGADAAAFLKWIVEAIEAPLLLSLEG